MRCDEIFCDSTLGFVLENFLEQTILRQKFLSDRGVSLLETFSLAEIASIKKRVVLPSLHTAGKISVAQLSDRIY